MWKQLDRLFLTLRYERESFYVAFGISYVIAAIEEQYALYAIGSPLSYLSMVLDVLVIIIFGRYLWKYFGWLPSYIFPTFFGMLTAANLYNDGLEYARFTQTTLESDTMMNVYILLGLCAVGALASVAMFGILSAAIVRESRHRAQTDDALMAGYDKNVIAHFMAKDKREADARFERISIDFLEIQQRDPKLRLLVPKLSNEDAAVRFMAARQLMGKKTDEALPVLQECAERTDAIGTVARGVLEHHKTGELKWWATTT
ncbi:MAG: HEAT repeat domain-containing protein [Candidatus Pacebacteria bacterium]|nr:HEAT repeat domain-containing protein [Candidatus Paceibacterota bacterium]